MELLGVVLLDLWLLSHHHLRGCAELEGLLQTASSGPLTTEGHLTVDLASGTWGSEQGDQAVIEIITYNLVALTDSVAEVPVEGKGSNRGTNEDIESQSSHE